jgi:hypothetical protein
LKGCSSLSKYGRSIDVMLTVQKLRADLGRTRAPLRYRRVRVSVG